MNQNETTPCLKFGHGAGQKKTFGNLIPWDYKKISSLTVARVKSARKQFVLAYEAK